MKLVADIAGTFAKIGVVAVLGWCLIGALAYSQAPQSQPQELWTINLADGDYRMTMQGGKVIGLVPIIVKALVVTGTAPPPNPSGLAQISETNARTINNPTVAQELAITLAVAVSAHSQEPYSDLVEAQRAWDEARQAVLTTPVAKERWKPWEDACNDELARLIQNPGRAGGIQTADDYVNAMAQINDGLKNYIGTLAAKPAIDLARIIELVQIFVDAFSGKGFNLGELLRIVLEIFRGGAMGEVK